MFNSVQQARISRRRALKMAGGSAALLSLGLWPGALRARDIDSGSFKFIVANDLHYFDAQCGPFFERVARQIKATSGVEQVLLAGDISDWAQPFQFAAVRDIFKTTGLPVHVVCGNHDWANWNERSAFLDIYPKSLNYTFEHRGWQFIGLDSTQRNLMRVNVTPETLAWLDATLAKIDPKRPIVMFTHYPMLPSLGFAKNAEQVLGRFLGHNLQAVYGGHFHAFREERIGQTTLQINRCCSRKVANHDRSQPQKGYFLCEARQGRISRTFVEVA
jgi:predicted phosphodiesterase